MTYSKCRTIPAERDYITFLVDCRSNKVSLYLLREMRLKFILVSLTNFSEFVLVTLFCLECKSLEIRALQRHIYCIIRKSHSNILRCENDCCNTLIYLISIQRSENAALISAVLLSSDCKVVHLSLIIEKFSLEC